MKFEKINVFNFEGALRGMRNPKNSWHLSDSAFGIVSEERINDIVSEIAYNWVYAKYPEAIEEETDEHVKYFDEKANWLWDTGITYYDDLYEYHLIGPKDMKLAQTLIAAGPEHRKFLRQIFISVDITAPLYWQNFCQ